MIDLAGREGAAGGLRAGLLLLAMLGVAGTALALAYERHWQSAWQLAPWLTLGIVSAALVVLVIRQTPATVWLARAVAIVAIVSAALGVWQHVDANLSADHAADHHADRQEQTANDNNHSHGEATTASDGHGHSHGEATAASDDHHGSDDEEPASSDTSLMDAMSGSAGHAPVPAALSLVPVGLALALATIGLGSDRGAAQG